MMTFPIRLASTALAVVTAAFLAAASSSAAPRTAPPAGLRETTPTVHAFAGAKIVVSPTKVIDTGTLVIRDGVIEAVGADVAVPAEARIWDVTGKTLYPGLIDAYGELSADASSRAVSNEAGAPHWNANVVPQARAATVYSADNSTNKKLRSQGITARLVAPSKGIIQGTSVLVSTADAEGHDVILAEDVALHLKLTVTRGTRGYPNSPMGAMTLVRQAFYDAGWYTQAWDAFAAHSDLERPERNDALATLGRYLSGKPLVIVETSNQRYFLRAEQVADEFDLNLVVLGSGNEYRRLDAIKATSRAVIVPVEFPKPPNVATPEAAMDVTLERLMHWDLAPENPGRLAAAGVTIALTSHGLSDAGSFLKAVRKAVKRGLTPQAALAALTTAPAELFDASERLGTLETGKSANVVITDGPLFEEKTKVLEVWVDGARHEIQQEPLVDVRGTWAMDVAKADGKLESFTIELKGQPGKLSGTIKQGDKSAKLIAPKLSESQFSASFKGEALGHDGVLQISGTVSKPGLAGAAGETPEAEPLSWLGTVVWADGKRTDCSAKQTAGPTDKTEKDDDSDKKNSDEPRDKDDDAKDDDAKDDADDNDDDKEDKDEAEGDDEDDDEKNADKKSKNKEPAKAASEVNFPLGAFGRTAPPEQPKAVLWRGATVWTSGPQGRLEHADVLIESGKITAVGKELTAPEGATVIDAEGKHISPGIIDCHSHAATDGGINESGQTITAEVRIGDFIDPTDISIYRQLAGGVTSANILHGSANTIGGQNQVVKFRWGALPEEMKFAAAPQGIKFALGENVKQSNWGSRPRAATRKRAWAWNNSSVTRSPPPNNIARDGKNGTAPSKDCRRASTSSWKPWPKWSKANASFTAIPIARMRSWR